MRPNWLTTASNASASNGRLPASPWRHTISGLSRLATASIPGLRSRPVTLPAGPTRPLAARATTPVPQATSSTRSPALSLAAAHTRGAHSWKRAGTNRFSNAVAPSTCRCNSFALIGLSPAPEKFPGVIVVLEQILHHRRPQQSGVAGVHRETAAVEGRLGEHPAQPDRPALPGSFDPVHRLVPLPEPGVGNHDLIRERPGEIVGLEGILFLRLLQQLIELPPQVPL